LTPLSAFRLNRRNFLRALAAQSAFLAARPRLAGATTNYTVGVGNNSDSYTAAQTAIAASGQFPSVAGQTVIIKPNLVIAAASTTGITTDPQVVRAIVDLALAGNPKQIIIAEGSCAPSAPFGPCGYEFFLSYANPPSLIQLVDLTTQGLAAVSVSPAGGLVYNKVWIPALLTEPNTVFISAAKLKTHESAGASLSMKNLVGIAAPKKYNVPALRLYERQDLHLRGIDEAIIDLIRVRPVDFAVIDGVWGMQGQGPTMGTAIQANLVFAGLNPTAVDVVALNAIQIPQSSVPYMLYAGAFNIGPTSLSDITVTGDTYTPVPFTPAVTAPIVWRPTITPTAIGPGQTATITYRIPAACYTLVEIISDPDKAPAVTVVNTLQNWTMLNAGNQTITWNGTDSTGMPVAPGLYLVNIVTESALNESFTNQNYASSMIQVT